MHSQRIGNSWPNNAQQWLLQACLYSGESAQNAWKQWCELVDFEQLDYASYMLLPLLSRNPALLSKLQDPIFDRCKGIYRRTWVENQLAWKKLLPILSRLRDAGVDKILVMKGMAMIVQYYRDFGIRVMGDIDIMISKEHLPLVASLLQSWGWQTSPLPIDFTDPNQLALRRSVNFVHDMKLNIDLHWGLIAESTPLLDRNALEYAQPIDIEGLRLYIPSPTDLFLQACVHGLKQSSVPLIRWVADAVTILNCAEKEIDWPRLALQAKETCLRYQLHLGLHYLIEPFKAPISKEFVQSLAENSRLERFEHWSNMRGHWLIAGWCRYCLKEDLHSLPSQLLGTIKYLQLTAHLKSPYYIPFYAIYWIFKRLYRLSKRIVQPKPCTTVKL
jgi:Uncharacterised nucleotidyltransferase